MSLTILPVPGARYALHNKFLVNPITVTCLDAGTDHAKVEFPTGKIKWVEIKNMALLPDEPAFEFDEAAYQAVTMGNNLLSGGGE